MVMAFSIGNGMAHFIYMVTAGVLQGDTLSGMLFAVCFDPFVRAFEKSQTRMPAAIRCCVNDCGAALANLTPLLDMKWIVLYAEELACLLEPKSC